MIKRTLIPLVWLLVATGATASPEVLIVKAAQDTTQGFVSRDHAPLQLRVLAWPEGLVSLPDTAVWMAGDGTDLVFNLRGAEAVIIGAGGRRDLTPGNFSLDTPVVLDDGRLQAFLARGRLEVSGDAVIYRRPGRGIARGGTLLMLAAIAVATGVLLRAARRRPRRS